MYIEEKSIETVFVRKSKFGLEHSYVRKRVVIVFRCDNCNEIFYRDRGKMSPKRLSNNYFHCCNKCDSKKFAQRKGVEKRTIWDRPASSLDDISKL